MKNLLLIAATLYCFITAAQPPSDPPKPDDTPPKDLLMVPVEFSGLSTVYNGGLVLMWATESEKNNDHFDILRSDDKGVSWSNVGHVPGSGTSKKKHQYTWSEGEQLHSETYYRLIQVDFDGKETELTLVYYDFTDSYYNGMKLNGKILSIRKVQEAGSDNLVIVVTDRQVYKIMSSYHE